MPRVRYAQTTDGVEIAYATDGNGPPLLVARPVLRLSVDYALDEQNDPELVKLAEKRSVVIWDPRGFGLSSKHSPEYTLETSLVDMAAVADATGEEPVDILAFMTPVHTAIAFTARNPERVRRLALWNPSEPGMSPRTTGLRDFPDIVSTHFEHYIQLVALRFFGWDNPKAAKWYVKTMMSQFDAESWLRTMETMEAVDATDEAGRVSCPVLVMIDPRAIDRRQVERAEYIRRLAATLPDGELVVLKRDGSRHGYGEVVESFLARGNSQSAAETSVGMAIDSSMRSVLFTDLVGHTEMMSRLGDERGRQVLREHERITREVLASHGGTEVKTMGDGFMASFGSVTRAVECAVALQRAFADHEGEPLSVRVGLNAGEPIEEEGDLFGATVILASRIAGRAGGGEILVSDTVRGLCSGKGFLFSDRGEFAAKGFEEPVRVYEVKWRE